ncbi:MAG TPA: hypothetical protein ENJ18_16550 [Nannocystis exedens]|nr:hypothetical protein [Nannocystis exedens]
MPVYRPSADPDPLALDADDLNSLGLQFAEGWVLPVLRGNLEFAWLTRQVIAKVSPNVIAVDQAASLAAAVDQAIARLPLLSVVHYPDPQEHGRPVYLPIEPADALIEAIRRGHELGLPIWRIGRNRDASPTPRQAQIKLPDPLAAERIGALDYLRQTLVIAESASTDRSDDRHREAATAHELMLQIARAQDRREKPRVLVICDLRRARHLLDALRTTDKPGLSETIPLGERRLADVVVRHLAESSSQNILAEMPFINAAYERARGSRDDPGNHRARDEKANADPPEGQATVINLFGGPPKNARAENSSPPLDPHKKPPEELLRGRIALFYKICTKARERYAELHGGQLRGGAVAGMLRYACRYALTENSLGPDLYHLVIAGRGFADDNYAQELWEVASTYPWQSSRPEIETLEVTLHDLQSRVRNLRFRPKQLRRRRRLRQIVKPPDKESRPGEWAEYFGDGLCSYQPDDLAIEGYGQLLRRQSARIISAAASRICRFTSTLGDGIDVRETLRNWHQKTIYIRTEGAVREQAGAVVVIFEDEPLHGDEREPTYPWQMTWQGEGDEEGDMALYATDPFDRIIGPGIGRALYGGFLLNRPAGNMFGVWQDSYFVDARSKAEVLLLAALDHSRERVVVYVAPTPPRRRLQELARHLQRKIIHIPLGQLSPLSRQRVRRFHVLCGPEVRDLAPRYIR